ncbi:MAG: transposase, partial [Candidatus Thiodiazotropha sp. (ex Lucinoma aequizonata)]|nr:transposase [Candidatus Thiodiazotropha sp. (ex Lucinoma aequizonata)]MCU7896901.1 transposase [Candidatus Thiodiazotropha sp. (ex Lucinoma aequizonata)]MCU7897916.1 transposase [Candidatus Thiodiazotropha sp. (ex Lucinoma aequizonata)]MCU7910214.1 transposase [Candidatus Thiodiazotropha sp. (ex Lucinoma aequizonata)]
MQFTSISVGWLFTQKGWSGEAYLLDQRKSQESKLDAISLVEEQGYATTEAASSLGIRPKLIRRWIRERQADDGQAFRGNG